MTRLDYDSKMEMHTTYNERRKFRIEKKIPVKDERKKDSKDPRFEGITEEQVKLIRYYISALTDTKCGFCGGRKRCGYMLCYTCFYILPKEFKKGLYKRPLNLAPKSIGGANAIKPLITHPQNSLYRIILTFL